MAEKKEFNRRDFLKVVGAGAGMAAAGCGKELPEKFIPYVIPPDEVIPGVSVWYSGSCGECSAGCGVLVRTREGRAVKVEGNPQHPVNHGGLCAQGQSSLQALYDPDRVRVPLKRDAGGVFKEISWKEAIAAVGSAMVDAAAAGQGTALITAPSSGSEAQLIAEFQKRAKGVQHFEYELLGRDALDRAADAVFGGELQPAFDFGKADVIVGVGADYLESWVSPVEYSRGWAQGRKRGAEGKLSTVYHIEPRLSLTGGNADRWIMNAPGSEESILRAMLAAVADRNGGKNLPGDVAAAARAVDIDKLLAGSGVSKVDLTAMVDKLLTAGASLVVAGGAGASGDTGHRAAQLAFLLNTTLGNIGKTVSLKRVAKKASAQTDHERLIALFAAVAAKQQKLGVAIISGVNPIYVMPKAAKVREALSQVGTVVSISTHLDETTSFANIVLPLSTSFEAWGDSEPVPGVWNLNQPAMQPLYQTQSLADTLIALLSGDKLKQPLENINSHYDFIRQQWKARTGEGDFEARWLGYVELGGDWSKQAAHVAEAAVRAGSYPAPVAAPASKSDELALLVYPSVNSHDGRSANRPWMQELPNPITTAVWGSWAEINKGTAAKLGIHDGDVVQVETSFGTVETPVYLTDYVHPQVVAIPLGQGHETFGRFATGVGVNALSLLPVSGGEKGAQLLAAAAMVRKSTGHETLVKLQGSDSQFNRGIARTVTVSKLAKNGHDQDHGGGHHGAGHALPDGIAPIHHHDALALGPRETPKMMYKQMEHPLYKWGMSIDLAACTGCSACVVACYAENNISVVGKTICNEGREMSWLRMERYLDGPAHQPVLAFVPMMCQHCGNAPCEPVCPVYATYHSDDGINSMVYNRCVGTRYCSNNCSYKVRRFNWFKYSYPEPLNWQLNPDVTLREVGVMEKCSFCVQRVREATSTAKDLGRVVGDGDVQTACQSSCPTGAIKFGNLNDSDSAVSKDHVSPRSYKVLDFELNTQPAIAYLARVVHDGNAAEAPGHGVSGHGAAGHGADAHGQATSGHSSGGHTGH